VFSSKEGFISSQVSVTVSPNMKQTLMYTDRFVNSLLLAEAFQTALHMTIPHGALLQLF
jgi:hypothetical protein